MGFLYFEDKLYSDTDEYTYIATYVRFWYNVEIC